MEVFIYPWVSYPACTEHPSCAALCCHLWPVHKF